jgi:hypothetical protein
MMDQPTFDVSALNTYILKRVNMLQEGEMTKEKKVAIATFQEISDEVDRLQELAVAEEEEAIFSEYQEAEQE